MNNETDDDCPCFECGCAGNESCGVGRIDKTKGCELDAFLVCPCCNAIGKEKNMNRWKIISKGSVMSEIVGTITTLRNFESYRKNLCDKKFTVKKMTDGRFGVKLGKKADVAIAPNEDTATRFADILNRMMVIEAERIETAIVHITSGVKQLDLFEPVNGQSNSIENV
jgi:hypothetical protein